MPTCRCSNGDVGQAWRMTAAARQIGQDAGNLSCRCVDRQYTIAIEVQHGSQPGADRLPALRFAPSRLALAIPSAISAMVIADKNRSDECKSIHSMSSGRLMTMVGDVAEMTLVSTR